MRTDHHEDDTSHVATGTPRLNRAQLEDAAYDMYRAHWIMTHLTRDELLDAVADYHEAKAEYARETRHVDTRTFLRYLEDNGFHGSLYVCRNEFLETEFQDVSYMTALLDGRPALLDAYHDVMAGTRG